MHVHINIDTSVNSVTINTDEQVTVLYTDLGMSKNSIAGSHGSSI